jgi:hypothetical protein
MSERILLIGSYSMQGIDSFGWSQDLPNISDYDIVILDSTRLANFWNERLELYDGLYFLRDINEADQKVRSNIDLVCNKLREILEFPVTVYALHVPEINIGTPSKEQLESGWIRFVGTNDCYPISIDTIKEEGKTILVEDNSFDEYFRNFKAYQYYFDSDSLNIKQFERLYSDRWKVTASLKVVATNKVKKPLAFVFRPCFHRWKSVEGGAYEFSVYKYGGYLMLLPVNDIYHTESLIDVLLKRHKKYEETTPPSWVSHIEIPGETSLKSKISEEKAKLEKIRANTDELESCLANLERYKGLLYETGLTLQELVKSTLQELGAKIERSPVSDEFIIEVDGQHALVEVKGNTKSIVKDDIAQLITDFGQCMKEIEGEIHGILIGNAWRLMPLEERGKHNTPIFSPEVRKSAQTHTIGLLSTFELFRAYCKALREPACKEDILNKLISTKGPIQFD